MKQRKTHKDFLADFKKNNLKSDKIEILGKYETSTKPISCKCKVCNSLWDGIPVELTRKNNARGCPVCAGKKVVKGVNDVATVRSDLIKYFGNIEDAYNHTISSCKEIEVVCPLCKAKKKSTPNRLNSQGFSCNKCSDFISYPNKFLKAFLEQFDLDFLKLECSPEWIKPYRLDSYFSYNGIKYIVEMDGALGHGNKDFKTGKLDNDGLKRDKIKEQLALKQGIEIIRIDCIKSDKDYISKNIIKSKLNDIFDLSNVDWLKCEEYATKNIIYEICDLYNSLPLENKSTYYMSDIMNLDSGSILTYLKRGSDLGLCDYSVDKAKDIGIIRTKNSLRKRFARPVNVIDKNNNFNKTYNSQYECLEDMNNQYPEKKFNLNGIISNCTGKVKTYKGFIFAYI